MERFEALPGGDLLRQGLADLRDGRDSIEALLISIGAPRLRALGLEVRTPFPDPEHRLYLRLTEPDPAAAHSKYNALIRRLVSLERALACGR